MVHLTEGGVIRRSFIAILDMSSLGTVAAIQRCQHHMLTLQMASKGGFTFSSKVTSMVIDVASEQISQLRFNFTE